MITSEAVDPYGEAAEQSLTAISSEALRLATAQIFALTQRLIDAGDVTLVVIAARRLACLYQLLLKAGMPPLTGCLVVSNRVLEANPDIDWTNSKVLVLDDSVVVGTTLYRLCGELRALGAGRVMCRAVCVDADQRVDYLLDGLDFAAAEELSTVDVSRYSMEVVKALFLNQVPFFTDYPTTVPLTMSKEEWRTYLESSSWHVADVTAPLLDDGIHLALAQIPTEQTFSRLVGRVSPAAGALVDGFKLRLYASVEGDSVTVVAVPIAMLGPCAPEVLDGVLHEICASTFKDGSDSGIDFRSWDPKAKHRLVQLYLSACVLTEAWPALARAAGKSTHLPTVGDLQDPQIRLYFGALTDEVLEGFSSVVETYAESEAVPAAGEVARPVDQPTPSRFLDEASIRDLLWDVRELVATTGIPAEPGQGDLTKLGLVFAHGVTAVFGFVNREFEMPQRAEIARMPDVETYERDFSDRSRRLLYQGFTLRELTTAIAPECLAGSPWQRAILSLGIDAGNDLGVIVPVTRFDQGRDLVYRCYRLGETAGVASTPLTEAVQAQEPDFDEMTHAVVDGFPVQSSTRSIALALDSPDRSGSIASLVGAVREAVPGVAVSRFLGTVTSVHGDRFLADLRSPAFDDLRAADMSIEQLAADRATELAIGSRFVWSVRQHDRGGVRRRVSVVRLLNDRPLDVEQLKAVGSAVAAERMADDDATVD